MNLGFGDQSKAGSLLDNVLQFALPMYGLVRNVQGVFEPEHREGTIPGYLLDHYKQPGGLFGNLFNSSSPSEIDPAGLMGFSGDGYSYDTYNFGGEDVGSESTDGGYGGWSSNSSADDMASAEVGSYASYDDPNEF
jgi:hypothetical protein